MRLAVGGVGDTARRASSYALPGVAHIVGVLPPKLDSSLRTLVEPIPELETTLDEVPRVTPAVLQRSGNKSVSTGDSCWDTDACGCGWRIKRQNLRRAAVVVKPLGAIPLVR